MHRGLIAGIALVIPLVLGAALVPAVRATAEPIPGTNVLLVEVDSYAKSIVLGGTVSFRWGLVNHEPGPVMIGIAATVGVSGFSALVFPSSFTLAQDQYIEPQINVTAPATGGVLAALVTVTFSVLLGGSQFAETRSAQVTATPAAGLTTAALAFAVVGVVVFIGFSAVLIFQKTKVPDLIFLIIVGLLLGPVMEHVFGISLVPRDLLRVATPYFAALALMIILFDGGLHLRLAEVVRRFGEASVLTLGIFLLTVFLVAGATIVLLGYPMAIGLLLAVTIAGTSSAVVIGVVRNMRIGSDTRIVLTLESVITDVLCVTGALALIEFLRIPGSTPATAFGSLLQAFFVAGVAGATFGLFWLRLLKHLERTPFSFMITIAALFVLFAAVEVLGGSGAMAAFVFGLTLGNHDALARRLRLRMRFTLDEKFKQFDAEVSFLARTFFFVFLGIVFSFEIAGPLAVATSIPGLSALNGTYPLFVGGLIAIFAAIVLSRVIVVSLVGRFRPRPLVDRRAMSLLMGRGLAAAVLATLPFTISAFTNPFDPNYDSYHSLMAPFERQFHDIVFFVILFTVVATTIGVKSAERRVDLEQITVIRDHPAGEAPTAAPAARQTEADPGEQSLP